jgi:outer membrane protein OmpA-like peptidoglycan-associated protein
MRGARILVALAPLVVLSCAERKLPPNPPPHVSPVVTPRPPENPGAEAARVGEEQVERSPVPFVVESGGAWMRESSVVAELRFAPGSSALSPDALRALDQVAGRLAAWEGDYRVEVEGHADGDGDEAENRLLAAHRAEAVRRYLGDRHAIPLERIALRSMGEASPATTDPAAQALNRRAVVRLGLPPS